MAEEKIEIEPVLETVLLYCLKIAREKVEAGEALVPFTAIATGDELNMKEHPADEPDESFGLARKAVAAAAEADAYAFCYDGFIEVEHSLNGKLVKRDCIIAEGGVPGAEYGHAVGQIYKVHDDGSISFNAEPIYVSQALNYLSGGSDAIEGVEAFTGARDPQA